MTSDFSLEVAKYPKSTPKPKIAENGDLDNQVRARVYCLAPLAMQLVNIICP